MIDPRFVYLAAALSLVGAYGYIRDTLRGDTAPNRVTWSLWGVEGVLAFFVEIQQHVGLAALMTLMLGLVPCAVVVASFRNPNGVWKLGAFDVVCAVISLSGLALWAIVQQPALALISFVAADQVAALPTLRRPWNRSAMSRVMTFRLWRRPSRSERARAERWRVAHENRWDGGRLAFVSGRFRRAGPPGGRLPRATSRDR